MLSSNLGNPLKAHVYVCTGFLTSPPATKVAFDVLLLRYSYDGIQNVVKLFADVITEESEDNITMLLEAGILSPVAPAAAREPDVLLIILGARDDSRQRERRAHKKEDDNADSNWYYIAGNREGVR